MTEFEEVEAAFVVEDVNEDSGAEVAEDVHGTAAAVTAGIFSLVVVVVIFVVAG